MEKVLMPKLGMAQSYCIIERWHKKEGDIVNKGDLLVEVSTDKISYEIEAKTTGYLIKRIRKEKEEVPANEIIALIGNKNEEIPEFFNINVNDIKEKPHGKSNQIEYGDGLKITALAKKIIQQNKINPSKIKGTGPKGRILKEDVLKFLETNEIKSVGKKENIVIVSERDKKESDFQILNIKINQEKPLSSIRKAISEKMVYSKQYIPHISQITKADMTKLVEIKEKLKRSSKELSVMDFIIKVVAMAIRENLELNSSLINDKFITYEDINIGIVTSITEGLIVPVIHECDKLTIFEIAEKRRNLVDKAQQNKLSLFEISNGTFTITNIGMYNVRSCTAIIYPPQAAILTVGSIYLSPEVVDNDKIEVRKVIELSITEDHRILDGVSGAKFLNKLVELFENPNLITD